MQRKRAAMLVCWPGKVLMMKMKVPSRRNRMPLPPPAKHAKRLCCAPLEGSTDRRTPQKQGSCGLLKLCFQGLSFINHIVADNNPQLCDHS